MNRLIKFFNEKYGNKYGKISYPRTTIQIYRVYQSIKSYGINDEELVKLLHNIKLPKPKTIEEKELYADCLYNKDDSEIKIDTGNLVSKENPMFTGSISMGRKEGTAIGENSVAIGKTVEALGECSYAEGKNTTASGWSSHAEGEETKAKGQTSHAEGDNSIAEGISSHAEGSYAVASGITSHAEGEGTKAYGKTSHAEGSFTTASSNYQHVQGKYNIEDRRNKYAHIVGNGKSGMERSNAHTLDWKGNAWYAGQVEGTNLPYNVSSKVLATVSASNVKSDIYITINGVSINKDRRYYIEFLGSKKLCSLLMSEELGNAIICSIGNYAIRVNNDSTNISINISDTSQSTESLSLNDDETSTYDMSDGETIPNATDLVIYEEEIKCLNSKYLETDLVLQNSISLGRVGNIGPGSSAIGCSIIASGYCSHAEGSYTVASGSNSHVEGFQTNAPGEVSHAEGENTTASGNFSHAEGDYTTATGNSSHAEGEYTDASGEASHAEGASTLASGNFSHVEGYGTTASGESSHAEGYYTKASSEHQHVQGKYNIEDTEGKYAHIVGNGNETAKSNAHTLDWNGNAWYAGKLSQEGVPTEDKDLITKKYADDSRDNLISNIYGNNIYNFQITEDEFNSLYKFLYNGGDNKIVLNSISPDTLNAIIDGDAWYNAISFNKKIILKVNSTGSNGIILYIKDESPSGYVNYSLLSLKSNESNIVTISYTSFIEYNYNDKIINLGILNNKVNIEKSTKNQYINATKDFELVLPNVTEYIEIHLYLTSSSTVSITFPPSIKWKDVPTIEANKVYEIIFKYINEKIGWIGEYKIYN